MEESDHFLPHIYVEADIRKRKCPSVACGMFGQIAMVGRLIARYEGTGKHRQCVVMFSGPASFTYYPGFGEGWESSALLLGGSPLIDQVWIS